MKTTDQLLSSNINTECSPEDRRDDSSANSTMTYAVVVWCSSSCSNSSSNYLNVPVLVFVIYCARLILKYNQLALTVPEWL